LAIDLFNLGIDLGTALGVTGFEGGLILTLICVMAVIIYPLYKKHFSVVMGLFIMVSALCVGLTWLNVYVFIIIIAATAGGLAYKFKDVFG
jgi:hypothetical protein